MTSKTSYGEAICQGFEHLLEKYPEVFVMGQGLWSPWYVGNSMTALEKKFGMERIIDTPVSELACTGAAVGASLCGFRPIVVHPRIDFMLYCVDAIVNQAAKWSHMVGGQAHPAVTVRGIINRGGEQGAQHSQALHSWFAHIPGLRVVMPARAQDARDLLISSVLCDDPVLYIDDRWLYEREAILTPITEQKLNTIKPEKVMSGDDITLVGAGYSAYQCELAGQNLLAENIYADVFDLRVINPLDVTEIAHSVERTGRLCVVDGSWSNCGLAGEVIASVLEKINLQKLKTNPLRLTLPPAPAPTSKVLENIYYLKDEYVTQQCLNLVRNGCYVEALI